MYAQLLWSFFQIGALSFGGGYAALPLIQNQIVDLHGWLSLTEFTDLITISQMTPGPIAINSASFVGYRLGGVLGAVVATLGNVIPSIIIVLALAYFYNKYKDLTLIQNILKGLRPAIVALISVACVSMIDSAFWGEQGVLISGFESINWVAVAIFFVTLIVIRRSKLDATVIMISAGLIGGGFYYFFG